MNIAFISYEYPPDTALGGIATYVYHAAHMLCERGHTVEVFTGSHSRSGSELEDGILVHRVREENQLAFAEPIGQRFAQRHEQVQFDVLEGPDYMADARYALTLVPDIPFVLKLHTPSRLLLKLNYYETLLWKRLYFFAWGKLHGYPTTWGYAPHVEKSRAYAMMVDEIERAHAFMADEIVSPSRSLGHELVGEWGLDTRMVVCVPYPFLPAESLLQIPARTETNVVTFIGRLEKRKGVMDLAKAIPDVLHKHPNVTFRFVGDSEPSPVPGVPMQGYLAEQLRPFSNSVEFSGAVPGTQIPNVLANTDICVFPSLWENFPCVCLESMAAARAVVASQAGGMADMLAGGEVGRVVPPRNPQAIAEAIIEMLDNPALRHEVGAAARRRLLSAYSGDAITAVQIASYERAIARRHALGRRV